MAAPLLEVRALTKRFPGVVALSDVSFTLAAGEVHALCGENGAGKSTLIKVLSGIHAAGSYEGEIRVDGAQARFAGIRDAEAAGIAVITQEFALVDELTVAENLFLGREPRRRGLVDWPEMHARTAGLLAEFGLDLAPETPVRALGIGQKQLLEILRALDKRSRVLVLDEPTAALPEHEVGILLDHLRRLRARGTACIYISHKLDEVFAIADRITVLRDGRSVAALAAAEASVPLVIRHMVGRDLGELFPRHAPPEFGPTRLEVRGLSVAAEPGGPAVLEDISLELRAGEVLGLGGLMGAGRSELVMHLLGLWGVRRAGSVELDREPLTARTPREALARGLALVTEDRKRYGLVPERGVSFNLSLSSLGRVRRGPFVDRDAEVAQSSRVVEELRIRAQGLEQPVATLSGGNQQKVVLGRMLLTEPKVLLLDEPTRGIDVGAKLEVYDLVNRLTAAGQAIVLVSSELGELMGMSDRIVMLHEGRVGGVFERGAATQEQLLAAAMGRLERAA